jgi:hypothetical protein
MQFQCKWSGDQGSRGQENEKGSNKQKSASAYQVLPATFIPESTPSEFENIYSFRWTYGVGPA